MQTAALREAEGHSNEVSLLKVSNLQLRNDTRELNTKLAALSADFESVCARRDQLSDKVHQLEQETKASSEASESLKKQNADIVLQLRKAVEEAEASAKHLEELADKLQQAEREKREARRLHAEQKEKEGGGSPRMATERRRRRRSAVWN